MNSSRRVQSKPTHLEEINPHQLFYQGANRAESSQKIVQKIWKISQITSKCQVATNGTNGSGDKNLPNNETGQRRANIVERLGKWVARMAEGNGSRRQNLKVSVAVHGDINFLIDQEA